jgi:SAM-dependent methyltransferase
VDRNPDDRRSVFYLAQSHFDAGDFANARKWYERRAEMGGWDEEVFWSLHRAAQAMQKLGEPWPAVQQAFLRAWAARPVRAESLHAIALHQRRSGEYRLGHLFAERAAAIPLPSDDVLFVQTDVYHWRALDEQAVCASWIGKFPETFAICQRLLARDDIPAEDRGRIAANRDLAARNMPETPGAGAASPPSAVPFGGPLRRALARRLQGRTIASGRIRLPAVPAMIDECQEICLRSFAAVGVEFTPDQTARLREALAGQLAIAYAASPRSEVVVTYDSPVGRRVNWQAKAEWTSVEATYDAWVATREPPYFGTAPDARVWSLANEAASPAACPVLDIGAGPGRNALPLARRGHPVDAIEVSSRFAAILRDEAARESLPLRVIERDLFTTADDLRREYGLIVLSEVASDFRDAGQLRRMFEIAAACLAPGGRLVFNIFLPHVGHEPDDAARQFGQQVYTSIFTYPEVASAVRGLPLEFVADDSAHDYEKKNLPDGAWPPTGWYADWASGLDVFDVPRHESPIELRWLVYRKPAAVQGG